MAVNRPDVILLRPHNESTQNSDFVYPNAKPSDYSRTPKKHEERKNHHENKLEILKKSGLAEQKKFQQFCNEVEDCYDTNMLLLICAAFAEKIENDQKYIDFLYKKILVWALKEAKLRDYLSKLKDIYENQQAHNQERPENDDIKVIGTLITMLNKCNFQFVPVDSSNTKVDELLSTEQPGAENYFSDDIEIGNFLTEIHYSSPKVSSHRNKHPLVEQSANIKTAISQIQLFFTANEEVKDKKFIGKVISALGQKGDEINITVGFLTRKSYQFNRHELLVLIRSNPILYAEFKKAGGEKKLRVGGERDLFTEKFVSSAKSLLSDRLILSTPIQSTDAQILPQLRPVIEVLVESEIPESDFSHGVEAAATIDSSVLNAPIQSTTRSIPGITLDFDDNDDLEVKTVSSVSTDSTDLDDNMDSVSTFGDEKEEDDDDFGEAQSINSGNSTLTADNLARRETQRTNQTPNIADVDSLSNASSIRSNKTISITPTKQQLIGSPRSVHSGLSDVLSINSSPAGKGNISAKIEEGEDDSDIETVVDALQLH